MKKLILTCLTIVIWPLLILATEPSETRIYEVVDSVIIEYQFDDLDWFNRRLLIVDIINQLNELDDIIVDCATYDSSISEYRQGIVIIRLKVTSSATITKEFFIKSTNSIIRYPL